MQKTTKVNFFIFTILNILDYLTTYTAINLRNKSQNEEIKSKVRERNPFIKPLVERGEWKKLFAIKCIGVYTTWHSAKKADLDDQQNNKTLVGLNCIMTFVVLNNTKVIKDILKIEKRG